jgi:hypothetical protein
MFQVASLSKFNDVISKLPVYSKINQIPLKTLDLVATYMNQENKDELIDLLNTEVPELRSYAFIRCLKVEKADFTKHFCDPETFDPENDFIIFESLCQDNIALMKFCISKGFDYTIHELNPFDILIRNFSESKHFYNMLEKKKISIDTYRISNCLSKLKILVEAGYDIHMDHSRAFKCCTNCELLKYFIEMGTDIKAYGEEWVSNFLESDSFDNKAQTFSFDNKAQTLKLMFDHGLSPVTNGGVLVQWACSNLIFSIVQLLDQYGVNFKEYEKQIIPGLGIQAGTGRPYKQFETISLEILKILWKHNCNLNLLNVKFIQNIIEDYQYQTLEWMFNNGIDIEKIYKEPPDNTDKIGTFNVLVKNGISVNDALRFI